MRVSEYDNSGVGIAAEQCVRGRVPEFMPVTDVDLPAFEREPSLGLQARRVRIVHIAVHGLHGRQRGQLDQDVAIADIPGVQNQLDAGERVHYRGAKKAVGIGNKPNQERHGSCIALFRLPMSTEPLEHVIATPTRGRYLVRVPETAEHGPVRNAPMIVAFHGYGESADIQMARLEAVAALADWTLVSIQGLHGFYGRDRAVVASWMTSQDREDAIEDNLRYVRSVVTEAIHNNGEPQALVYVGYSQGVAMAWRAALLGARLIDGLAVFGGDVPAGVRRPAPDPMPARAARPRP